jgi:hypothetical protein
MGPGNRPAPARVAVPSQTGRVASARAAAVSVDRPAIVLDPARRAAASATGLVSVAKEVPERRVPASGPTLARAELAGVTQALSAA